jgi:hypothetical protein
MSEPFTAVAMCPKCNSVAVHPWREPRYPPEGVDPRSTLVRKVRDHEIHVWGGIGRYYDAPDAVVVRQCACGAEWGQS